MQPLGAGRLSVGTVGGSCRWALSVGAATIAVMDDEGRLTAAAIDAHAAEMTSQPWWGLVEAELALPPCPVCGDRQLLTIDGSALCESAPHADTDDSDGM